MPLYVILIRWLGPEHIPVYLYVYMTLIPALYIFRSIFVHVIHINTNAGARINRCTYLYEYSRPHMRAGILEFKCVSFHARIYLYIFIYPIYMHILAYCTPFCVYLCRLCVLIRAYILFISSVYLCIYSCGFMRPTTICDPTR